ncbi:Diphthamide biosynthesis protein 2 [Arachnomyces sp. PD_36]|nr:Diphthamide biosynthesis protein 2 [Arachnomyces sp. PD_36]
MAGDMAAAPVLSTPDTHILDEGPVQIKAPVTRLSDEELRINYDIERTLKEIRQGRWKRVALQFPDEMLSDSPRVFQLLARGLETSHSQADKNDNNENAQDSKPEDLVEPMNDLKTEDSPEEAPELYILADTSYGTCCVDEVAAEHVNADVVVHYGRACLSPTARLPVIHVFTHHDLSQGTLIQSFKQTYPDTAAKVIITASVEYSDHVSSIYAKLVDEGYTNLFATSVLHDPSSPIPNRTAPEEVKKDPESLKSWQLFHISDPPTALLLTLSSRVSAVHIYPTKEPTPSGEVKPLLASTASVLRRRYATLTSLTTVPIFGILINTLSVKNYLHIVEHVKEQIAAAGKKSYTFVVGKLNAAKVANFSEIGGWVVIGCWESSLIDSADFWKPVITPYELELALKRDEDRVWTGEWRSDYQSLLDSNPSGVPAANEEEKRALPGDAGPDGNPSEEDDSEPESAPPEFDLRTGRYISVTSTRPMQPAVAASSTTPHSSNNKPPGSKALAKRANGDLATIGNTVSPGAEFLRSQRTWKGLGSDFDIAYEEDGEQGTAVVEGRSGIARGYTVGDDVERS